jgi:hypothetical protein
VGVVTTFCRLLETVVVKNLLSVGRILSVDLYTGITTTTRIGPLNQLKRSCYIRVLPSVTMVTCYVMTIRLFQQATATCGVPRCVPRRETPRRNVVGMRRRRLQLHRRLQVSSTSGAPSTSSKKVRKVLWLLMSEVWAFLHGRK